MRDAVSIVLPFVSVLFGASITYAINVRQRHRTRVEDVFHEAISAVAVARTSHDWIGSLAPWKGATDEEHAALLSQLGREGNLAYARAVADARAAVARASAYDPRLAEFVGFDTAVGSEAVYARADEIMSVLRANIDRRALP